LEFLVAGAVGIPHKIISGAPDNIQWLGDIPRSKVPDYYEKADVFILPTISDGFAITQIEALSFGVPAIVTPNCARIVEDGKTGFVIPASDTSALIEALKRFLEHPDWISQMRPQCLSIRDRFSLDAHSLRLKSILTERLTNNS